MKIFSYPSILTFVLGAQMNRLISFEYQQHMFWLRNLTQKKKLNALILRQAHSYVITNVFLNIVIKL